MGFGLRVLSFLHILRKGCGIGPAGRGLRDLSFVQRVAVAWVLNMAGSIQGLWDRERGIRSPNVSAALRCDRPYQDFKLILYRDRSDNF